MRQAIELITPRLPKAQRLRVAAFMWGAVGCALLTFGLVRLYPVVHGYEMGWSLLAILIGLFKGLKALRQSVHRTISRVAAQPERYCLFSFFSWWSWGLVILMIVMGRILRHSSLSPLIVYNVYVAVGIALISGSLLFWRAFRGDNGR